MDDARIPKLLYITLSIIGMAVGWGYYAQLPERMASHFGPDGTPNGWMPKESFYLLSVILIAAPAFLTFVVPKLVATLPAALINLPNKEYWLAPERRLATVVFLQAQMAWFGCGLLIVLLYGSWSAIQANLSPQPFNNQGMLYVLVVFSVLLILWLIRFYRHFSDAPR